MKTRLTMMTAALAALALLAGCQPTPERGVVTSKNDGTFEAALAATPAPAGEESPAAGQAHYADSFVSADGAVRCTLDLDAPALDRALPVYRAEPREISAQEAERVAHALLGQDTVFYEYSARRTQEELEQDILNMRRYIGDSDTINELFADDAAGAESYVAYWQERLDRAEALYAAGEDGGEPVLCDWTFHPGSYYADPVEGNFSAQGEQVIRATAQADGLLYEYTVTNLESAERREHSISLGLSADQAAAPGGEEPPADGEMAQARAMELAEAMDLGQWTVRSCTVYSMENGVFTPGERGSRVNIELAPVVDGLPLTTGGEPFLPQEGSDMYAPRYSYESIFMMFHGDVLEQLTYTGALTVTETVSEDVPALDFDQVVDAARAYMRQAAPMYAALAEQGGYEEREVNDVQLGLSRTLVKNDPSAFYLIPTYTFYSSYRAFNADGSPGTVDFGGGAVQTIAPQDGMRTVVINAVDGSVFDPDKGY